MAGRSYTMTIASVLVIRLQDYDFILVSSVDRQVITHAFSPGSTGVGPRNATGKWDPEALFGTTV